MFCDAFQMVSVQRIFATFFVVVRDWVRFRHVNPEVQRNGSHCSDWSSSKYKAFFRLKCIYLCFCFVKQQRGQIYSRSMGSHWRTRHVHLEGIAPTSPLDHRWVSRFLRYHWKFDTALWYAIVATSPVVLRWLCDSQRTGCARRTTSYICGANK